MFGSRPVSDAKVVRRRQVNARAFAGLASMALISWTCATEINPPGTLQLVSVPGAPGPSFYGSILTNLDGPAWITTNLATAPTQTGYSLTPSKPGIGPNTRDLLPDAVLLAENGRPIKLSDFHGRALAITFLFTRCPLPDFCPRLNHQFSRARELLREQVTGPTNWQFLSISFDAEFDRPPVLARYARSYRGADEDRWLFASASSEDIKTLATALDFHFANEGGSFAHNLRTVVLDPERRISRQFDGNKWKAANLAEAMKEAAEVGRR